MSSEEINNLKKRIQDLESENHSLRKQVKGFHLKGNTVKVPDAIKEIFDKAEETVGNYFTGLELNPSEGTITINDERYVLVRASALSHDFFNKIIDLYADRGEHEAVLIGKNFLFDISHVIGIEDARRFHERMNLKDPISKLSAGPVHFAYAGWAFVEILPESRPVPDESYFIKYNHPYSFEADSWIKYGKKSNFPVCAMNAGYSSGWCEESFGIPLTAVEISCRAKGDEHCTFIMAPPHKIHEYLTKNENTQRDSKVYDVPMFFERKKAEEAIKASLQEKEILLKEIHHRVKNNLQVISSLLKLQSSYVSDARLNSILQSSQQRIKTMAIVHEKLYQSDLQYVNAASYVWSIAQMSYESFAESNGKIKFDFDFTPELVYFKIDKAIPCGLMVNEIITNSFKYAFEGKSEGKIFISVAKISKTEVKIIISDNGIGIPDEKLNSSNKSLGMELIDILASQIEAKVDVDNTNGTNYTVIVPLD